jgi:hypothetical protein
MKSECVMILERGFGLTVVDKTIRCNGDFSAVFVNRIDGGSNPIKTLQRQLFTQIWQHIQDFRFVVRGLERKARQ